MEAFVPAAINRMLLARALDLVARRPAGSKEAAKERGAHDAVGIAKSLGLHPIPPRTPLNTQRVGETSYDGYRLLRLLYNSRPGITVPAHLYLPTGLESAPLVVYLLDDEWDLATPWVQSAGIGFALSGFAVLIVAPLTSPSRGDLGDLLDPKLCLGAPATGQYVWDAIRGIDCCEGIPEVSTAKVGVVGAGTGGVAATFVYALEERVACGAFASCTGSLENEPDIPTELSKLPGLLQLGDAADWLSVRAPNALFLLAPEGDGGSRPGATERTYSKLKAAYRGFKAESCLRLDVFLGPKDLNRRMRECCYAFFAEALRLEPSRPYVPEKKPLTDGAWNPAEGGTLPVGSPELQVQGGGTTTMQELMRQALLEPHPEEYHPADRMPGWGRYGRVPEIPGAEIIKLSDTDALDSILIPSADVRADLANAIGLSIPEVYAQILHQALPGGPEGWEQAAIGQHALTSVLASVKTLVAGATPSVNVTRVHADGPFASATALFLQTLRPEIEVSASHYWSSWSEMAEDGMVQPQACYLKFPLRRPLEETTNEPLPNDISAASITEEPLDAAQSVDAEAPIDAKPSATIAEEDANGEENQ